MAGRGWLSGHGDLYSALPCPHSLAAFFPTTLKNDEAFLAGLLRRPGRVFKYLTHNTHGEGEAKLHTGEECLIHVWQSNNVLNIENLPINQYRKSSKEHKAAGEWIKAIIRVHRKGNARGS